MVVCSPAWSQSHRLLTGCLISTLGRPLLGSCNLVRETTTVLIDSRWKLVSELVQLVDDPCKSLLALEISAVERARDSVVVLLAGSLQVPKVLPARETMPRKRIDSETVILVPNPLLSSAECEFSTTAIAREYPVCVPLPWAD